MRRVRFIRIAAYLLGGILVLAAGLVALLHTPPARRFALQQSIRALEKLGIGFAASRLDFNLLKLQLELREVTLRSEAVPALPALFHAGRVAVDLSLAKLIRGAYHIEEASIENPRVHIVIDRDGRDNIPKLPETSSDRPARIDYLIRQARISGGSIRFEDRRRPIDASLLLDELTVHGDAASKDHEIRLKTMHGGQVAFSKPSVEDSAVGQVSDLPLESTDRARTGQVGNLPHGAMGTSLPIRDFTADVRLSRDSLFVRGLRAQLGDSSATLSGRLEGFDKPKVDLKVEMMLGLRSLAEFAGLSQALQGSLRVSVHANGPLAEPRATIQLNGGNLSVERFTGIDLRADAAYNPASSRVELHSMRVGSALGSILGQASLALTPQAGDSTANFAADGVRLERISSILRLPVRIASSGAGRVQARWKGLEFQRAEANAAVRLVPERPVPAKDTIPVAATLEAKASGNRLAIGIEEFRSLGMTAAGGVELVDLEALQGQLTIEAPALSSVLPAAEAFLGKESGSLAPMHIEGALTSTVTLSGTMSSPAAAVSASVRDLSAGGLRGISMEAAASYSPERLSIDEAVVNWQGQRLRATGQIGLGGGHQPLQLKAATENVSAGAILAGLGKGDLPMSGDLAAALDASGTVESPQAKVTLTATGLRAYGETVGALQLQARYAARRAELSELRLEKPQPGAAGLLTASGAYDVESKRYQLQARAQNLRLLDLELPGGTPVRGSVDLQISGAGSIDEPAADSKLVLAGLQVDGRELGRAEFAAKAANRQLNIEGSLPEFGVGVTASVGIPAPNPATVEIRLRDTDLSKLPVKMDNPLEGTISAILQATGDLENYNRGSARAQVSKLDLVWNGVPVSAEGPVTAGYSNRVVTIQQANLRAAGSRLQLSGSLPLDRAAGEGAVKLSAQLDLPGLIGLAKLDSKPNVQGRASIEGAIRGTLQRIDPSLTVAMEGASLAIESPIPPVTNATLRAQIRDGALDLESVSAEWGGASFRAAGTIPFALLPPDLPVEIPRRQGPAKLTAGLSGVNLAPIPGMPQQSSGMLSLNLEAEASRPELQAVHAVLTFSELRLGFDTYTVGQKGESKILLEKGVARVEHFQLSGPSTDLELAGSVDTAGDHPLDLRLDGKLDAALVSAFAGNIRARGATEIHAALSGTARTPQAKGFVEVADGQLAIEQPRIGADGLKLRVDLDGTRATVSRLEGEVNGGKLSGKGSVAFAEGKLGDSDLAMQVEDLYLDFPAGLKTLSDIKLQLRTVQDRPVLRGSVLVKQGGFTSDLFLDKGILAAATAPRSPIGSQTPDAFMEAMRLNVSVVTQEPIVLENNLVRAQVAAQLVVLGSPREPGLAGRLIIEEGGQLTLQERKYDVQRGVITFTSDRRIEPNLDLLATTKAADHDITLQISGPPGKTETVLTSNPDLGEPDILALLVTGKTLNQIRGQELEVAQNQALSYLTGRMGSSLGRGLESATGLSRVRIEPNLIAAEANPGARLTVGQDITPKLGLIYSMDLVNSSDQIYAAEYSLTKRFATRGVRQADGSYRFDFRHDLRFGGARPERVEQTRDTRRIGNLTVSGRTHFPLESIQGKLKVKQGSEYDFFKVRQGMDRVSRMYVKGGLLESNLRLERQSKDGKVDLTLNVDPGPKVTFAFEGAAAPGEVEKEVRRLWHSGVFDGQRAEDAIAVIREWLIREKYLKPQIEHRILTPVPDEKRVVFEIHRGARFEDVALVFDGAKAVDPKRLRSVIEQQKLSTEVYTKPERVTELLTQYYQEMGYLDAAVEKPKYELQPESHTGKVVFPVKEGPLYRVGEAVFEGNRAISSQDLLAAAPLPRGEGYRPVLRENAIQRLRQAYWARGYNDVEIQAEPERLPEQARIDLRFRIAENAQAIAREVVVTGNRNTSENLIRSQLKVAPGDPVNLDEIGESRRKLYNTGAFSLVEIARQDLNQAAGASGPVRLHVRVKEVQPFELKYGGFFDTERGPGGIFDFSNRNSLGSARVLGLRGRYDSQLREARLYFSQPLFSRFPIRTIASPYLRRELNPETDLTSAFNVDRIGISLQQEALLGRHFILNYGYKIEKSRTYDTGPDAFFDVPLRIATLTSTFSRETRDEILDAARGSFFSSAIQYSPEVLGSQVRFVKYFGQYFRYIPLQKPRVQLFTNQVLRPRLVYATGVRVGLAGGLGGQDVPVSERFFAGGATTIRGFEQNSVGPATLTGTQLGGQAMLVFNNELRFPLISIFDGVGFVDVGNVYRRVSDLSLANMRKAAGAGIRVRTPWFLLRLDYGFKLDRQPGETRGRLFFSIGQAF